MCIRDRVVLVVVATAAFQRQPEHCGREHIEGLIDDLVAFFHAILRKISVVVDMAQESSSRQECYRPGIEGDCLAPVAKFVARELFGQELVERLVLVE